MSEKNNRWKWLAGGGLVAGLAIAGGLRYYLKEKATPEPDHLTYDEEGRFALKDYLDFWVAETVAYGERREAIRSGFRTLADYIFGRSHEGETIPMTSPVLEEADGEDRWKVRFVMPEGESDATLPTPPSGVTLKPVPGRRYGVIRFAGAPGDYDLETEELSLRGWLRERGEEVDGPPIYAFYNSPAIPGPLRRNEVWIPVALTEPVAT
ncbi:heme-binding protein [Sphingomicrobium sp. XHP0239]|uniref:SOUL family heme-binding protein n=1 Tax=Sphingomicrobium maritimum TaxID=3133972 RepID=UPI0031CC41E5